MQLTAHSGVRQAAPDHAGNRAIEPIAICPVPLVEAVCLFVEIPEQVEWFDADVRPAQRPLEEAPEVLHPIRMNLAVNVLNGVVDDAMGVKGVQAGVGLEFVGVER